MAIRLDKLTTKLLLFLTITTVILDRVDSELVSPVCELSVKQDNKVYKYSLSSPIPNYPHGVLSEDGCCGDYILCGRLLADFLIAMSNDLSQVKDEGSWKALASKFKGLDFTRLQLMELQSGFRFAPSGYAFSLFNLCVICLASIYAYENLISHLNIFLCDGMIFNHHPPLCFDCQDCGGTSHCGMKCSALVANNVEGYFICTAIGRSSSTKVSLIDKKNPHTGVVVKMNSNGPKVNCSLSVSVICDSNGVQGPSSLVKSGICDYETVLKHPSGCPKIISAHGRGWGWFGTLVTIFACLLVGYLLAGTVYRYFALGIRGIEVIPNLEFWLSLPQKAKSLLGSVIRRFRGPSQGHRSSYSPVNF
ncbi:hypothetical protein GIB67_036663 [Kingdonia uniflora]|uniref:Autophagy-related protein 27 n=1 Tax=Kingdonia uniflora TaxID=39325 RepID=A0A7J7LWK9_9MAGN|nr:hypothetical protein GIB67_036663 [Kingdonia uniflora]